MAVAATVSEERAMRWSSRLPAAILLSVMTCIIIEGAAFSQQVGAAAGGSGYESDFRTHIAEPSAFINGTYGRTYWGAVTFPNGTFFQSGYLDASNQYSDLCQTGFATFVTGLNSSGQSVFSDLYNDGHCNLTGDHYFRLLITNVTSSAVSWRWALDGVTYGPTLSMSLSNSSFQRLNAGVISEIVDPNPIGSSAAFPTVTYNPAIQFKNSSGVWVDATHGHFLESPDNTCRYALKVLADADIRTGLSGVINATQCYSSGDSLW
ncbi:hypothetical protein [Nocardioides sp. GY 10127]|uniref:hypothetical protein n=1 Tax=Nocardioides sp. GY 10127 TaxID=2569762 RepID=UPI0010A8C237|nr:hypothetical protein [Nocardioides sp. GY 10127]TIC79264.1 hypothetical protein E8D37_16785 [Nocardioides sp. GY 10127]